MVAHKLSTAIAMPTREAYQSDQRSVMFHCESFQSGYVSETRIVYARAESQLSLEYLQPATIDF